MSLISVLLTCRSIAFCLSDKYKTIATKRIARNKSGLINVVSDTWRNILLYFLFSCYLTVQSDLRHNHLFFSSSSPESRVSLWGPALVNMILPQDRFHLHKNNRKTEKIKKVLEFYNWRQRNVQLWLVIINTMGRSPRFRKQTGSQCRISPFRNLINQINCKLLIDKASESDAEILLDFSLIWFSSEKHGQGLISKSKRLVFVLFMLSALALQVWLMYSSTLVSSYCIADFCLPKCPIKLPKLNGNEKVHGQFAEIQSSDLAPDTHCFIRMEPPKSPIFFKFSDFNSTRSFAQVSWNYRGQDKIEELNSFVLDASISNWKPVVDSGFESAEGNDFY